MGDLTNEIREVTKAMKEGSFSPQAVVKLDSGGIGTILAVVSAAACLLMLAVLVVVVVQVNGQLSGVQLRLNALQNKDDLHDAYLQQQGSRIGALETKDTRMKK